MPVIGKSRGLHGIAFGSTDSPVQAGADAEPVPEKFTSRDPNATIEPSAHAIVVIGGYDSVERHLEIRAEREQFGIVAPLLVRNARAIEKHYVEF